MILNAWRRVCCGVISEASSCDAKICEAGSILSSLSEQESKCNPGGSPIIVCTPAVKTVVTASTLSACRPRRKHHIKFSRHNLRRNPRPVSHSSVSLQDSMLDPVESAYGSTALDSRASSSFAATFLIPDHAEADEMKINVKVDEHEDDDVLSMARYNAFVASARELEVGQNQLHNRLNSSGRVTPSHHQLPHRHSCGITDEDTTSYSSIDLQSSTYSADWKGAHSSRFLDFSELVGGHPHWTVPSSCSFRNKHGGLCSNSHTSQTGHSNQQDCCSHIRSEKPQCLFSAPSYSYDSKNTCDLDNWWTCKHPFLSPPSDFANPGDCAAGIDIALPQPMRNFQTAFSSANKRSGTRHTEIKDPVDWTFCDDFLSHTQNTSYLPQSCDLTCSHLIPQPISELQSHKADQQHQTRNLFDDLGGYGVKPQNGFRKYHSGSVARRLFRMASPDSNGSPVWVPPLFKNIELGKNGFV